MDITLTQAAPSAMLTDSSGVHSLLVDGEVYVAVKDQPGKFETYTEDNPMKEFATGLFAGMTKIMDPLTLLRAYPTAPVVTSGDQYTIDVDGGSAMLTLKDGLPASLQLTQSASSVEVTYGNWGTTPVVTAPPADQIITR